MSRTRYAILVAMLAAGAVASAAFGRLGNPFAAAGFRDLRIPLSEFPREVRSWRGADRPLDARTVELTGLDRYLRREYVHEDGARALFFVAYFGNKDRGLASIYHNPTVCLPSAGYEWTGSDRRSVTLRDEALEFSVSLDTFRRAAGEELLILSFFVVDERRVLAQSPRNDPFWLGLEKVVPTFEPGYLAQIQIVTGVPGGDRGRASDLALRFLAEVGGRVFRHL